MKCLGHRLSSSNAQNITSKKYIQNIYVVYNVTSDLSMSSVADMCWAWNGGCAKGAKCSQIGEVVTCTCPKGHSGDGFSCQPVDPCVSGDNGGCHEHATCIMTAPVRNESFKQVCNLTSHLS